MSVVLYEKKDKIAYITLNRPEVLNVYNHEMLHELEQVWPDFKEDPNIRVGILTGTGERAFCGGADHNVTDQRMVGRAVRSHRRLVHDDFELHKPVIAALNGLAVSGGLTLAMACDIRVAAEHAKFGLRQPIVGLISDVGAELLPRMVPMGIAMEMLLTCKLIDAQEALRWGLVNRVVAPPEVMPTAIQIAETICEMGPLAIAAIKETVRRSYNLPLFEARKIGAMLISQLYGTEDFKEGVKAFKEKRKPVWKEK